MGAYVWDEGNQDPFPRFRSLSPPSPRRRMRSFLLLALALPLFVPGQTTAQTFQVETSVSDVTGVRQVASADLRPLPVPSYPGSHTAFRAVYETAPDRAATWQLVLFGYTADTTALSRTPRVRLRTDGTQLKPNRIVSDTRTLDGTLLEVKRLFFTRSQFAQVARADSVILTVGSLPIRMNRVLRTDLRLILDRVSSPQQASEPGLPDTSAVENGNGPDRE